MGFLVSDTSSYLPMFFLFSVERVLVTVGQDLFLASEPLFVALLVSIGIELQKRFEAISFGSLWVL